MKILILILSLTFSGSAAFAQDYKITKVCWGKTSGETFATLKFNDSYYVIKVFGDISTNVSVTYLSASLGGGRGVLYFVGPGGMKDHVEIYLYSRYQLGYSGRIGAENQCRTLSHQSFY